MALPPIRPFGAVIDRAVLAHANDDRRHEICGVVTAGQGDAAPVYHRLPNRSPTPQHDFVIDAASVAGLGEVLAVVHSHPEGPPWPSAGDLRRCRRMMSPRGSRCRKASRMLGCSGSAAASNTR